MCACVRQGILSLEIKSREGFVLPCSDYYVLVEILYKPTLK